MFNWHRAQVQNIYVTMWCGMLPPSVLTDKVPCVHIVSLSNAALLLIFYDTLKQRKRNASKKCSVAKMAQMLQNDVEPAIL